MTEIIIIPSSVTSIDESFMGCTGLLEENGGSGIIFEEEALWSFTFAYNSVYIWEYSVEVSVDNPFVNVTLFSSDLNFRASTKVTSA